VERGSGWDETQRAKVSWELEGILEMYSMRSQRIVASISSRDVWTRMVPVQAEDTDRDLREKAVKATSAHLPDFEGNYVVDYGMHEEDSDGGRRMVVVAARKEAVDLIRGLLDRLRIRLSVVDVDCFALEHAYRWNYDPDEWVWIAQIGARTTELVLLRKGDFRRVESLDLPIPRDQPEGSSQIEALKARGEEFLYVLAKTLLKKAQAMMETEAAENAEKPAEPPTLMLSGPGSQVPYLVECFRSAHPGPVELLDPFRRVRIASSVPYRAENLRHSVQEYAVALGLALRRS